jgi:hypothetical protein
MAKGLARFLAGSDRTGLAALRDLALSTPCSEKLRIRSHDLLQFAPEDRPNGMHDGPSRRPIRRRVSPRRMGATRSVTPSRGAAHTRGASSQRCARAPASMASTCGAGTVLAHADVAPVLPGRAGPSSASFPTRPSSASSPALTRTCRSLRGAFSARSRPAGIRTGPRTSSVCGCGEPRARRCRSRAAPGPPRPARQRPCASVHRTAA